MLDGNDVGCYDSDDGASGAFKKLFWILGDMWGRMSYIIFITLYVVHCCTVRCIMVGKMMALKNEDRDDNNGSDQTPIAYTDEWGWCDDH